jgi:NAD+ diphosphatase
MEINFCRRCGQTLTKKTASEYECPAGHHIFVAGHPATGVLLVNPKNEVLLVTAGREPGRGKLDVPGGFCELGENLEEGVHREITEELGLTPHDYGELHYLGSFCNTYEYAGEATRPLDVFFWAHYDGEHTLKPADDITAANWYPLTQIDPKKVRFVSMVSMLEELRRQLGLAG